VALIAAGNAPEGSETALAGLDKQQLLFYVVQFLLLLIILTLSVFKPG
jgi:hypothetical protein